MPRRQQADSLSQVPSTDTAHMFKCATSAVVPARRSRTLGLMLLAAFMLVPTAAAPVVQAAGVGAQRVGEENMTVCVDKCVGGRGCKTYIIEFDECFSPLKLWPGDEQWGEFDIKVSNEFIALVMFHHQLLSGQAGGHARTVSSP
jgi:hypothetical protein